MKKLSNEKAHLLLGAVRWIADNDNDGDNEPVENLKGYISVLLVADTFEIDAEKVARTVWKIRNEVKP